MLNVQTVTFGLLDWVVDILIAMDVTNKEREQRHEGANWTTRVIRIRRGN